MDSKDAAQNLRELAACRTDIWGDIEWDKEDREACMLGATALEEVERLQQRIAELESRLVTEQPDRYIEKGVIHERGSK